MSATTFTHPDPAQTMAAIENVHCVLTSTPEGVITAVNDNYLRLAGYSREELVGHTLARLMEPADGGPALPEFWASLRAGQAQTGEFKRISKSGKPFWINACYTPIRNAAGEIDQVGVFATDITDTKREALLNHHTVTALSRSQAVIEFTPTGEIVTANENFLRLMGYRLEEIRGQHHRIFVPLDIAHSTEYLQFWRDLAQGVNQSGEFRRIKRSGEEVWIHGSYAAVLDERGKVDRVIKMAQDATATHRLVEATIVALGRLAEGDLTHRLGSEVSGDFAPVRDSFNATMERFSQMVIAIRSRADQMNGEAGEIARGSVDLAKRGETQAVSLEKTAAAVEEISGNVTMTSQSAREADASAREAQKVVLNGAEVVAQAIAAIERIDEHTKQMGEFTRVIEGFAFQTNLLSINAAVEAARAGEVGRGFAVVANEVRNLAQQSAKASQNIAELIGKSETEVRAGVKLVRDAGTSLDQIRSAVSGMVENIAGIAHATTEQATGVREVSQALSQLDSVNQANLAMSEQYTVAASSLSHQVEELGFLMERFQTSEDLPRPAERPAERASERRVA